MTFYRSIASDPNGWGWPVPSTVEPRLRLIVSSLNQAAEIVRRSVAGLDGSVAWRRPAPGVPAIANLLLHLIGTEHEWIHHKIGRMERIRDRDGEFAGIGDPAEWPQLVERWEVGRRISGEVIAAIAPADIERPDAAAGVSIAFALHYTEQHIAYHAAQIVLQRRIHESTFGPYGRP